jgi:hypothetical protein
MEPLSYSFLRDKQNHFNPCWLDTELYLEANAPEESNCGNFATKLPKRVLKLNPCELQFPSNAVVRTAGKKEANRGESLGDFWRELSVCAQSAGSSTNTANSDVTCISRGLSGLFAVRYDQTKRDDWIAHLMRMPSVHAMGCHFVNPIARCPLLDRRACFPCLI